MTKSSPSSSARTGLAKPLLVLGCIACFSLLSVFRQSPPEAIPSTAAPSEFSSERALGHLRAVALKPHPIGSQEHDKVRDYILSELAAQGVGPQVQEATAINERWGEPYRAGTVQNIVARLKGTGEGTAILLAAHYDSVTTAPGASDDGSGVVALLETLRALKAGAPLKNDVIFLFTDGEEAGLLGAIAFTKEHPWMGAVKLALNFEARGRGGPSIMFETSPNNGWLVEEFAKAAQHPIATSLAYEIYRRLPNDTDFTVFKEADLPGLNFAYIEGVTHYHSMIDNIDNIDERSIQHHGSYALALTRHFGNLDLERPQTGDAVYFDVFGSTLIRYPVWLAVPLAVILTILFAAVVILGLRRKLVSPGMVGLAFLAVLLCLIVSAVAATVVWRILEYVHPGYGEMPTGVTYNGKLYTTSFVFLTLALVCALLIWFRRRISLKSLAVGAWLWWLILVWLTSAVMPGASYLFAWPLLFGLIGAAYSFLFAEGEPISIKLSVVLALTAICAIIILVPAIYEMSVALPLALSGGVMILVALTIGLLVPHIELITTQSKWWLPGLSIACALILIVAAAFTSKFDKDHPRVNNLFYGLDADKGEAIWASIDNKPDEWSSQFFSAPIESGPVPEFFPMIDRDFIKSKATATTISAPEAALVEDSRDGETRRLRIHISSARQAPLIAVYADANTEIINAAVNGKPLLRRDTPVADQTGWGVLYFHPSATGIEITLEVNSRQPVSIRVVDLSYDLPSAMTDALRPRPNYMMPYPVNFSDATLVSKSFTF